MARDKNTEGPSKSQSIRDYIADHPGVKASEVVTALEQKGIKCTKNLVYLIMSKAGAKKRRKRRENAIAVASSNPATNGDAVAVIRRVKGLAKEVGGIKKLKDLVEALAE